MQGPLKAFKCLQTNRKNDKENTDSNGEKNNKRSGSAGSLLLSLFRSMALQANKLRKTISIAVQYLDNMDELLPVLANLGKRHALEWEVKQHHYDAVGECLLWTLQTGLEDAWTDDVGKLFLLFLCNSPI